MLLHLAVERMPHRWRKTVLARALMAFKKDYLLFLSVPCIMTLYLAARFLIKSERLLKNKAGVWLKKYFFLSFTTER